jgi:hypothetical protein
MGEKRNACRVFVGKSEGNRQIGRSRRRWMIILKFILEKENMVVLTGFIWLRIGTNDGIL